MKSVLKIMSFVGLSFMMTSCFDKSAPNYQFFPNMYEPVPYETYAESDAFKSPTGEQGKEGQIPAVGTIKRGLHLMKFPIILKDMQLLKQIYLL